MIGSLGWQELLIILVILALLFGASRVAGLGGALGRGIREFRREARADDDEDGDGGNAASPGERAADRRKRAAAPRRGAAAPPRAAAPRASSADPAPWRSFPASIR